MTEHQPQAMETVSNTGTTDDAIEPCLRKALNEQGRSPVSAGLLRHEWYNTPNIRFFSIADFEEFCQKRGIRIHQRIALDTEEGRLISGEANLLADMAIFVISR